MPYMRTNYRARFEAEFSSIDTIIAWVESHIVVRESISKPHHQVQGVEWGLKRDLAADSRVDSQADSKASRIKILRKGNRKEEYQKLTTTKHWDLIIIGGGATGLGIALDGALRGYKTLLCEAKDFAQGTSSRSTKLLHGGVRYLAQCDFSLVYEALRERDRLIQNAPHLCKEQTFIIPNENLFQACFYTFGLKIYDYMAGALGIGKTSYLKGSVARDRLKGIRQDKIQSGVCYYDGQFDDARLALALAQSAVSEGACVMNYARIESLLKDNEKLKGVRICLGHNLYEWAAPIQNLAQGHKSH